jgi:hypothetical protein
MATVIEIYRALGKLIDKGKGDYTVVGQFSAEIHVPEDKDVIDERNIVEV